MDKLKPEPLAEGAKIGIVAPASPLSAAGEVEKAVDWLKKFGFRVVLGKSTIPRNGYLAGSDQERLNDLEQMWRNDSVAAVWCLRGGYGSLRLLPQLDYDYWARHPKILVGFSDITALELALWSKIQLVTFHGPVLTMLGGAFSGRQALAILSGQKCTGLLDWPANPSLPTLVTIRAGRAEGILLGGNLTTLVSLLGTPFFPDLKQAVLFIEEVNEAAYRVDRLLTQLRYSGALEQVAGIMIGRSIPISGETEADLIAVFQERLGDLGVPVAYGWPVGHLEAQWTLPQGVMAEFDADSGNLQLREEPLALS